MEEREIKFRVWNRTRDELAKNIESIVYDGLGFGTINQIDTLTDNILFSGNEAVLMQYTSLNDKNGVEIYEGDVVALEMWHGNEHGYIPEDGVVKWYQPSSAFKWLSLEEDPSDGNNYWLSEADEKQREVIGNIYENPELLRQS